MMGIWYWRMWDEKRWLGIGKYRWKWNRELKVNGMDRERVIRDEEMKTRILQRDYDLMAMRWWCIEYYKYTVILVLALYCSVFSFPFLALYCSVFSFPFLSLPFLAFPCLSLFCSVLFFPNPEMTWSDTLLCSEMTWPVLCFWVVDIYSCDFLPCV